MCFIFLEINVFNVAQVKIVLLIICLSHPIFALNGEIIQFYFTKDIRILYSLLNQTQYYLEILYTIRLEYSCHYELV